MTAAELAGVVEDLDEEEYHRHPALSASGAKRLLPPSCPALFKWERDNGRPPKRDYDVGHIAHARLLGVGGEAVIVKTTAKDGTSADATDYRTKSAQDHRDAIRAAGNIPLLATEMAAVEAMVAAVRAHPDAGPLFVDGRPELSLFWEDWAHGVSRRARLDWLTGTTAVDLKTCVSAEPKAFAKTVFNLGYELQQVFYTDGIRELLPDVDDFLFVAVEKTPPYLVEVYRLDVQALRIGRQRVDQALRTFADCERTGVWPGYGRGVQTLSPPPWLLRDLDEDAA